LPVSIIAVGESGRTVGSAYEMSVALIRTSPPCGELSVPLASVAEPLRRTRT
jgi:hypothetical protein